MGATVIKDNKLNPDNPKYWKIHNYPDFSKNGRKYLIMKIRIQEFSLQFKKYENPDFYSRFEKFV